jgi:hypothetical protein
MKIVFASSFNSLDGLMQSRDFQKYIVQLLASQGIQRKSFSVDAFQKSGSLSVGNADVYYNFNDAENASYSAVKNDAWYLGNLWLNPYLSSYTGGVSAATTYLVTHNISYAPLSFEVDKRADLAAVDGAFVSRLYFEDIFITALRVAHNNANAVYKVPFFFSGFRVSLR